MEKSAPLLLLLLLLVSLLAAPRTLARDDDDGLPASLTPVCGHTRDANLCRRILRPALSSAGSAKLDAAWALSMHIRALKKSTQQAISKASAKSKSLRTDRFSAALKGCASDDYVGSLNSLITAEQRLASRDLPGLKIELSAVLSGYGYCNDEFVDIDQASPVAKSNAKLSDIASLALDLSELIK